MYQLNPRCRIARPGTALLLGMLSLAALAAAPAGSDSAAERYHRERAACLAGQTSQDRATCLKEAGAALAEARRGTLDSGLDASALAANRLLRCQRQPAAQRLDCERLARGEGSQQGSVAAGGVIRELVTRSVGSDAAAEPAQAASR